MARRRNLTLRPIPSTTSSEIITPAVTEEYIRYLSNPRNGICIGDRWVIISLDYASQELKVGAVVSGDPAMCNSYSQPEYLIATSGKKYKNPANDLHLLTAATVTHPHLIEGHPEENWFDLLNIIYPGEKTSPRQMGKTHNFGSIYLSSPQSVSSRNHIKLDVAESWVKRHKQTYAGYYAWAEYYGSIAAARGFAIAPYTGRIRWVAEERSSGKEGDSAVRAAVNHAIQSISADQTKESMIRLSLRFKDTPVKIIGQVHDEILLEAPGRSWVDWEQSKLENGVFTELKFGYDEEAESWALIAKEIMENVQTEMFQALGSDIKGSASYSIGPVWAH